MLKLHQIFLRRFIALVFAILLVVGGITYFWLKNEYIEQTKEHLLDNIKVMALHLKSAQSLENLVQNIKEVNHIRTTLINDLGVVIAESHKDKENMDNHAHREEIIQSKYQDYGWSIRYSNTLKKELLYVVKMYRLNGKPLYIRMAKDIQQINDGFLALSIKVGFIYLLFVLLSLIVTYNISQSLQDQTNQILKFLSKLTKQKKELKISSDFSLEFHEMTKLLTKASKILAKKEKNKAKYTEKLRQSNRQKDDIISAISHEFKNPISIIQGYSQTILEDKDMTQNIQENFLKKISSNATRLTQMIDRLRLTIKLDEGKQPHNFTHISLKDICEDAIENLHAKYSNRTIEFANAENIKVTGDETLLNIAISNLIENALKYSEDDVMVQLHQNRLDISDHGIGLNESEIEKVTQKFYRVSQNGWNNSLGIGLSIVSNILKIHNFKLEIKSIEGEGSTFSILF